MSNKKSAPEATELMPLVNTEEKNRIAELEAKLAAFESEKKKFEEEALTAVLKRVNMTPQQLAEIEGRKVRDEAMVEYDLGTQVVHINGVSYSGRGRATAQVVEVLASLAGNYRNAKLKELTGNKYDIQMLASGGIKTRLVGTVE